MLTVRKSKKLRKKAARKNILEKTQAEKMRDVG